MTTQLPLFAVPPPAPRRERPVYSKKFRSARQALFDLLSDLRWHEYGDCATVAGIRYGARLLEIRRDGFVVETRELETGRAYRLAALEPGAPRERRVKVFLNEEDAQSIANGVPTPGAIQATCNAIRSFRANKGG